MSASTRYVAALAVLASGVVACSDETAKPAAQERPRGLWNELRGTGDGTPDGMAELADLPYLRGKASVEGGSAVARYDLDLAQDGLNLVVSAHAPQASLLDMKGNVLHTWTADFDQIWPGALGFEVDELQETYWRSAELLPNGGLLALFDDIGVVRLDANSKLLWAYKGRCHDDVAVAADGTVYVLARPLQGTGGDEIAVLSHDGVEQARFPIAGCFDGTELQSLVANGEALQANSLEVIEAPVAGTRPMWVAGQLLVSLPKTGVVAVLDPEERAVRWAITGPWKQQHQPSIIAGGNLLVFDNFVQDGVSRAVEVDPGSGKIVWKYEGSAMAPLWTAAFGGCQRLPNGNTLIVESEAGRALEVTPSEGIVWEYFNPHLSGRRNDLVATLCELQRLDRAAVAQALPDLGAQVPDAGIDMGAVESLIEKNKK